MTAGEQGKPLRKDGTPDPTLKRAQKILTYNRQSGGKKKRKGKRVTASCQALA